MTCQAMARQEKDRYFTGFEKCHIPLTNHARDPLRVMRLVGLPVYSLFGVFYGTLVDTWIDVFIQLSLSASTKNRAGAPVTPRRHSLGVQKR